MYWAVLRKRRQEQKTVPLCNSLHLGSEKEQLRCMVNKMSERHYDVVGAHLCINFLSWNFRRTNRSRQQASTQRHAAVPKSANKAQLPALLLLLLVPQRLASKYWNVNIYEIRANSPSQQFWRFPFGCRMSRAILTAIYCRCSASTCDWWAWKAKP